MRKRQRALSLAFAITAALSLALSGRLRAQTSSSTDTRENHAGYVPMISGGFGYVHNVNGGVTSVEPLLNPVLLVPFGSHVLLESRTDFTGFYQRKPQPDG